MRPINISVIKVDNEEKRAIEKVLESGMIVQGQKVAEFEEKFAKFCGSKYAVAVNSGTAALHCACYALGISQGDEVITSPFTFVASANCVLMSGGKVVFADINEETYNISPLEIKKKINSKTKAIIPIDLYGQPYDYEEVKKIADKYGLKIIEDACQAVGAKYHEKKAGTLGDIGCFSFYATKNLMTGEGGMLVTNNEEFAKKAKMFRSHGQEEGKKYQYYDLGYNYRMTDMIAALGIEQLKKVIKLNSVRIQNAQYLLEGLSGIKGLVLPKVKIGNAHVFHQFTIRIMNGFRFTRDELYEYLAKKGIHCGIYYPQPIHLSPHFQKYGHKKGECSIAEKLSGEVISLPIHPYLTKSDLDYMIKVIKAV